MVQQRFGEAKIWVLCYAQAMLRFESTAMEKSRFGVAMLRCAWERRSVHCDAAARYSPGTVSNAMEKRCAVTIAM